MSRKSTVGFRLIVISELPGACSRITEMVVPKWYTNPNTQQSTSPHPTIDLSRRRRIRSQRTAVRVLHGDLHLWISGHLREKLTVEVLAERALMSPRNFARVYKQKTRRTPAKRANYSDWKQRAAPYAFESSPISQSASFPLGQ